MTIYPLDIAAQQVVRWLLDEQRGGVQDLTIRAFRQYLVEEPAGARQAGLSDDELADLNDVTAVGMLEINPSKGRNGWTLRVRFEDPLGSRVPEQQLPSESEEEIDLAVLDAEFASSANAIAFVNLEAETDEDWLRFQRILAEIRTDQHQQ